MKYRPEIDGLRAIAVMIVIFYHAGLGLFGGGFIGVDVFFVISGYLITTIITNELGEGTKATNKFSIVGFYERRVRRILPALFLMLLAASISAWLLLTPDHLVAYGESLAAVSVFGSNFYFLLGNRILVGQPDFVPLIHTWSLAVEEQFYVLFPLFLIIFWRFGKRPVFWLMVLGVIVSFAFSMWAAYNMSRVGFFMLPTRGWEILAGSVCALILQNWSNQNAVIGNTLSALGLILICGATVMYDIHPPVAPHFLLSAIIGAVLVILFAAPGTVAYAILSNRVFVSVGLISYSAYLWHQPLFVFARVYLDEVTLSLTHVFILTAATLFISWVSYRYIEQPFRNRNGAIGRREIFAFALIGIIISSAVGLYFKFSEGAPARFDNAAISSPVAPAQD